MHLCFCPFHPSYWRWKVQTVDPVSMGAKQKDALLLLQAWHHQLEKQLLIFNACNKCEHIHVDLEYPKRPASHRLAAIAMNLCFCPFHPSYWRWKVQTVDPVNMGAKQKDALLLQHGFPPPIGETTLDFQRMHQVRTHTCWSWISETACKSSSGCHCDASLLLPFPPFILKMEGPDCRSCQHGCKAKRCSSLATGLSTTNWRNTYWFSTHATSANTYMLILNIGNSLQVIIWLPLRWIFAFALSTLHIEDGRSRL